MCVLMLAGYLPGTPPYELIGKLVVEAVLASLLIVGAAIGLLLWYKGWNRVSRWAYDGEDAPPVWRMRVAGIAAALARFKFHKLPAVYAEAPTLTDNNTTLVKMIVEASWR